MLFSSLASGSAANATFVRSGDTRILVDNGLSVKELTKRLGLIGERPQDLTAIVLSHSHGDHASGVGRLAKFAISRGRAIPIYLQNAVEEHVDWHGLESPPVKYYDSGETFVIGGIQVQTITTPHDCPGGGVAFTLADNQSKVGIATDLGFIPPALVSKFRTCGLVFVEANYDPDMLAASDRPEALRQRIAGRNGHLSNEQMKEFLLLGLAQSVQRIVLGHRSLDTNSVNCVHEAAMDALWLRDMEPQANSLVLAERDHGTGIIEIP